MGKTTRWAAYERPWVTRLGFVGEVLVWLLFLKAGLPVTWFFQLRRVEDKTE